MQMLKPGYDLQYFRTKCLLRDVQEKITKCVFWSFVTRFFQFEIVIFGQVTFCAGGRYFAKASVGGRLGRDYMCCQHNWNFKLLARVMLSWSCQRGGEDYMCCQHNCNFKLCSTFSFTHSWFRKPAANVNYFHTFNSTIVRNYHRIISHDLQD